MGEVGTQIGDEGDAALPATRAFPVGWLTIGIVVMALLIVAATAFTFDAHSLLRHLKWDQADSLHRDIEWDLQAAMWTRGMALCLLVAAAVFVWRGARKLDAARRASEACSATLRDQKRQLGELNQRLFDEARIDPLTKLQTRLRLSEDLEDLWANAERHGDRICAVMCDVDRFKEYNDTYGHIAGDDVLRRVADALLQGCRIGDRLYRYGGEEFLLLLRVASTVDTLTVADRHRAAIESLGIDHIANEVGVVTVSMGVAPLWAGRFDNSTGWIAQADVALYRAKRTGRNCIAVIGEEASLQAAA
jgi:diguanylate cyclase (GGDEF)-like protein